MAICTRVSVVVWVNVAPDGDGIVFTLRYVNSRRCIMCVCLGVNTVSVSSCSRAYHRYARGYVAKS